MKARITYNLPEDNLAYDRSYKASHMASALWDISQYLRTVDKYESGHTIEQIREKFYSILSDYDINIDNLIE